MPSTATMPRPTRRSSSQSLERCGQRTEIDRACRRSTSTSLMSRATSSKDFRRTDLCISGHPLLSPRTSLLSRFRLQPRSRCLLPQTCTETPADFDRLEARFRNLRPKHGAIRQGILLLAVTLVLSAVLRKQSGRHERGRDSREADRISLLSWARPMARSSIGLATTVGRPELR